MPAEDVSNLLETAKLAKTSLEDEPTCFDEGSVIDAHHFAYRQFHIKAKVVSALAEVPRVDVDLRSASGRRLRGIHQ